MSQVLNKYKKQPKEEKIVIQTQPKAAETVPPANLTLSANVTKVAAQIVAKEDLPKADVTSIDPAPPPNFTDQKKKKESLL